jgi:hypothetical protein
MAVDGTGAGTAGRIAWIARSGYVARGVVYLIVGGLAVLAALGSGGETTDSKGALRTIIQQPFGQVLLGLVALGLVSYAVWRLVQAIARVSLCRSARKQQDIHNRRGFRAGSQGAIALEPAG